MSRHRPNPGLYRDRPAAPVVLDDRYQAEIERSLRHAERAYASAAAALARAERKAARREADLAAREEVRLAEAIVTARLRELRKVQALMQSEISGSNRSGKGSVRFVPKGHRGL